MTIDQFQRACDYHSLSETDKVCHLAFFYLKKQQVNEFSASDGAGWLVAAGGAVPNKYRLEENLRSSRHTVRAPRGWRLKGSFVAELEGKFPSLSEKSQEVLDEGTILPPALYEKTPGYIESIAKQVNSAYEHNIFDGCAALMRRMEEILLILSYEKLGIAAEIKDGNNNYFLLEGIVKNAVANPTLSLSRNSKTSIEDIRKLGNYSAHKITYTCKREYIREKISEFRALIDELLHKSGLRV
ncbi:MAG: hypothetical protein WBE76_12335 [Terracidiphilus sp.]